MTTFYPTLTYADAHAAIDFLCTALGFQRQEVMEGPDGRIGHAELRYGDGIVMLGSKRDDDFATSGTQVVYVALDDTDAHHARAVEAGAEIVRAPFDTDYGSRDYAAKDPEGNIWAFGTYRPEAESATT
jgi:uncharacterized glyoxalase superfamily protein PhnB